MSIFISLFVCVNKSFTWPASLLAFSCKCIQQETQKDSLQLLLLYLDGGCIDWYLFSSFLLICIFLQLIMHIFFFFWLKKKPYSICIWFFTYSLKYFSIFYFHFLTSTFYLFFYPEKLILSFFLPQRAAIGVSHYLIKVSINKWTQRNPLDFRTLPLGLY